MPELYPMPVFHFRVDWGGKRIGFSEVTGLTQENQVIEYRDGFFREYSAIKRPGLRKHVNCVCKRGIVKGDNDIYLWMSKLLLNRAERRDVHVSLLDDDHMPVVVWTVINAFPVKIEGPQLKALGNEIAIESMEFAHEGIVMRND